MPKRITIDDTVKTLWSFKLRGLGLTNDKREPFWMHAALSTQNERDAVKAIKKRFTPGWWEDNLITEVHMQGQLHMIDGIPLYEVD